MKCLQCLILITAKAVKFNKYIIIFFLFFFSYYVFYIGMIFFFFFNSMFTLNLHTALYMIVFWLVRHYIIQHTRSIRGRVKICKISY